MFISKDSSKLDLNILYPLASRGFTPDIFALWQGEKRNPKKGECYLSGAIIEAYRAHADISSPYPIAKLVRVEKIVSYEIVDDNLKL